MSEVLKAIKERSSTRQYKSDMLTDEQIGALIEAGLQAPTATNRQELHFTVLKAGNPLLDTIEDEKNKFFGSAPKVNFYYNAPVVIVISGEEAFGWTGVDSGIAVENIAIAAEALGLGNVIIGCIKPAFEGGKAAELKKALGFPDGYNYTIAIAVGYKDTEKEPHGYDAGKQVTCL